MILYYFSLLKYYFILEPTERPRNKFNLSYNFLLQIAAVVCKTKSVTRSSLAKSVSLSVSTQRSSSSFHPKKVETFRSCLAHARPFNCPSIHPSISQHVCPSIQSIGQFVNISKYLHCTQKYFRRCDNIFYFSTLSEACSGVFIHFSLCTFR